jgi:hypothetical protein
MIISQAMSSSLIILCLSLLVGCGASAQKPWDSGGGPGDAAQTQNPIVSLQDLNGIWAEGYGTSDVVMPRECLLLPANILNEHPEAPANLPGRFYLELKEGAYNNHWLYYSDTSTCANAGFHEAGVPLVYNEGTLVSVPGAFYDSDGLPVQQFQSIAILEGGRTFTMYVLLKTTAGTSSYHELLWSSSTKNVPFQSLQENSGWWIYRRPI